MKSRPYGIHQLVTWLTLVPLLLMAISLESYFLHAQFAEMENDLLTRGQLIARQLASSSEYGIFSNNHEFLAGVAKNSLQEGDVKAVIMLNAAAGVIGSSGEQTSQAITLSSSLSRETPMLDIGTGFLLYQPILSTQIALDETDVDPAPRQIGAVIIEMTRQRMNSQKVKLFWLTILVTAVFLLITLYLVHLSSRLITKPVRELSKAIDAIGAGDLDTRVAVSSRVGELSTLGNGINKMAAELQHEQAVLQAAQERLNQANRNLEQAVEERTGELSTSLNLLQHQTAELQASRNRLQTTFNAIPDMLLELGQDGHVYSYHVPRDDFLVLLPEQFLGKNYAEVLPPEAARVCQSAIQEALDKGWSGDKEFALHLPQGEYWYELSIAPMPEDEDRHRRLICLVRDITERKRSKAQLSASEVRYFSLFHDASDAIAIADASGILEEVNHRFALLLGYEEHELRGMFIEEIHPNSEMLRIRRIFADTLAGVAPSTLHTIVVRKDGMRVEVEIHVSQIEIGGRKVAQGIFFDLTERKRLEQQRIDKEKEHRDTLVREVHHRIKNNLQSIAGLLHRELGKYLELDPHLETAISQIDIIAVVHGLQGANSDEETRLCDVVQNICKSVADLAQRPLQFHVDRQDATSRRIRISNDEAVSMALILNELAMNAIKHSPQDSPAPQVSVSTMGDGVQIAITNATAVAPDFNMETRRGIGTGLSLVRSLLPEQGAQLTYALDSEGYLMATLTLAPPVVIMVHQKELG